MRHLVAAAPFFALVGCAYVNLSPSPTPRLGPRSSSPQPVSVRVGTPPEKTIEASESAPEDSDAVTPAAPAAEATASADSTQA